MRGARARDPRGVNWTGWRSPACAAGHPRTADCRGGRYDAAEGWSEDDLFALVRRAWPYRDLERREFDAVIEMLSEGPGDLARRAWGVSSPGPGEPPLCARAGAARLAAISERRRDP